MPYKTEFGFTITDVRGECCNCGKDLTYMRGSLKEFKNCLEIRSLGICEDCKLVVECMPIRHYEDGHYLYKNKTGWHEGVVVHSGNKFSKVKWFILVGIIILVIFLAFN